VIEPMFAGAGKVGSTPRSSFTGAECTTKYQVYNLTADPVRRQHNGWCTVFLNFNFYSIVCPRLILE
jgi:hypothetical protein